VCSIWAEALEERNRSENSVCPMVMVMGTGAMANMVMTPKDTTMAKGQVQATTMMGYLFHQRSEYLYFGYSC